MPTIPTIEPTKTTAGDTVKWLRSLPDYPASAGWQLSYAVRGASALDLDATPSGDDHLVSASLSLPAGDYTVQGRVAKGEERYTIFSGTITVTPDLSAITGSYDGRSQVKRTLDAINAVLEGRASKTDQEMLIDGTRMVKIPHTELLQLRSVYANRYWRETNPGKIGPKVKVRFTL